MHGDEDAEEDVWQGALQGALFSPPLHAFSLLLQLRGEALPRADQGLTPPLVAPPKRLRQPDALSHLLHEAPGDAPPPPPKRARAFLDAFPDKVWIKAHAVLSSACSFCLCVEYSWTPSPTTCGSKCTLL
jgi:hypothetical protein